MNSRSPFKSVPFATLSLQRLARLSLHLIVAFLALGIICSAVPGIALARNTPSARPDAAAEQLTHSLVAQLARYQKAGPAEQGQHLEDLITLAADRRQLLSTLIEENPGAVLRVALPKRLRTAMPAAVQDYLEQGVELEGELEVLYEDYEDFHRLRYFLKANGKRFSLHFADHPPKLLTGAQVRVTGTQIDGTLALESGETSVQFLTVDGADSGSSSGTTAAELENTLGEQRTLVLLVNFQDDPANQPWTVEEARSLVFGTVSDFFRENSYGQTWLTGDVYGWFTLPIDRDSTNCPTSQIADEAESAATAAGVNLSDYARIIYVFPTNACGFSGMATFGGNPSRTWINGRFDLKTVSHELGHNFGLYHAHSLDCGDATLGSDCTSIGYGDTYDTMGNPTAGHFSPFAKERLGWLSSAASSLITTVDVGGTYTLASYESAGTNPKVLKILKSMDPVTGHRTWYYVEYRQAIGFDSFLIDRSYIGLRGDVTDGVVVRLGTDADDDSSYLLHMKPEPDPLLGKLDWFDPALEVGASFYDPDAGITIWPMGTEGSTVSVSVSFEAQPCLPVNPSVSLFPSDNQSVQAGTPVSYTVSVINNDNGDCGVSRFNLQAAVPDGWTAIFNDAELTLEPGASASTTLTVSSPVSAPGGSYNIDVTAANSADTGYAATASATYVISTGGDTVAPIIAITSPQDSDYIPSRVTIQASASDDSGISRIELYVDGTLKIVKYKSPLRWNWNTRKETGGPHKISVKAFDTAENEGTETVTVYK